MQCKQWIFKPSFCFDRAEQEPKEALWAAQHPLLVPGRGRQRSTATPIPHRHCQCERALVSPCQCINAQPELHKFPFPTWHKLLDQNPDLLKLCQINNVHETEVKGQRTVEYYMQYGTLCNMVLVLKWRKCCEGTLELLHCACIWSR